jgi:DNA-binding MarR family transcriptional regulator
VGARLHLDSGTLTPLLKRMEQLGLVARRRRAGDDRVVGSWLTPRGRALKKRAAKVPLQLLCNAKIEMDELPPMRAVMDRLIAALLPLQPDSMH